MAFQDYSQIPVHHDTTGLDQTPRRRAFYRKVAKRALDIVLVMATLPITLPILLLLMSFAARDGHNPIYRQPRIGRDGRIFHMVKIRTMVPGAHALLESHLASNPEARREWDKTQKLKCDPRITPAGRVLRKSSLDELPQLWNVLTGDMSLVGPRPMMVGQDKLYPGTAYFALRPGITGPWQISDRNESSFHARAGFDNRYLATLSLPVDLGILVRTVMVVLRGTGY